MQLRKTVCGQQPESESAQWLAIDRIAEVAVSSEDPQAPLEDALIEGRSGGWRAGGAGEQWIRFRFDQPQDLSLIHLQFDESEHERVQEFDLEWSGDGGRTFQPIVRQQFSFSPGGATRQAEHYRVDLRGATNLHLRLVPDVGRGPHRATLTKLRLR